MPKTILIVNDQGRETFTLRTPSLGQLLYMLFRLLGRWAHPWMATGGRLGLLREAVKSLSSPSRNWVIVNRNGEVTGMVMLDKIDFVEKTARLSYAVLPEFQKRGYASRAASKIVSYGYERLGLVQIWTNVLSENQGSNKILDKLGFQRDPARAEPYFEGDRQYTQEYGIIPRPTA